MTTSTVAELTRFRGTCNSARFITSGSRPRCAKVVRFWTAFGTVNAKVGLVDNHPCPDCGQLVYGRPLKVLRTTTVCTSSCWGSKSANCACSCEGENHGGANTGTVLG
jgi:hypothetical protein